MTETEGTNLSEDEPLFPMNDLDTEMPWAFTPTDREMLTYVYQFCKQAEQALSKAAKNPMLRMMLPEELRTVAEQLER